MQLRFDAMEIDNTSVPDVEGLLDSAADVLSVTFHKKGSRCSTAIWDPGNVVVGVLGAMDVPVFIPKARIESVFVDDNSDRLLATFSGSNPTATDSSAPIEFFPVPIISSSCRMHSRIARCAAILYNTHADA